MKTLTNEQAAAVAPLIRRHLSATFDRDAPLAVTLRDALALLDAPDVSVKVMSREEGIAACARKGWEADPLSSFDGSDVDDAVRVLNNTAFDSIARGPFGIAVIAHARHLVATGQCPALANEKALK